jgi:hypothetical protein
MPKDRGLRIRRAVKILPAYGLGLPCIGQPLSLLLSLGAVDSHSLITFGQLQIRNSGRGQFGATRRQSREAGVPSSVVDRGNPAGDGRNLRSVFRLVGNEASDGLRSPQGRRGRNRACRPSWSPGSAVCRRSRTRWRVRPAQQWMRVAGERPRQPSAVVVSGMGLIGSQEDREGGGTSRDRAVGLTGGAAPALGG